VTVVSNYQNEISAVTVAPDLGTDGIVFAASFCDGTHLFEYALPDLNHVRTLTLSQNIPLIQGIGYHNKLIYVDADSGTNALIYAISPETGEVRHLASLTVPKAKEYEGWMFPKGISGLRKEQPDVSFFIIFQNDRFAFAGKTSAGAGDQLQVGNGRC